MPENYYHNHINSGVIIQNKSVDIISRLSLYMILFSPIHCRDEALDGLSRIIELFVFGSVGLDFVTGDTLGNFGIYNLAIAILGFCFIISLMLALGIESHKHFHKETWFAYIMLPVHAYSCTYKTKIT